MFPYFHCYFIRLRFRYCRRVLRIFHKIIYLRNVYVRITKCSRQFVVNFQYSYFRCFQNIFLIRYSQRKRNKPFLIGRCTGAHKHMRTTHFHPVRCGTVEHIWNISNGSCFFLQCLARTGCMKPTAKFKMSFHFRFHIEFIGFQSKNRKYFHISHTLFCQMKYRHTSLWFRCTLRYNHICITLEQIGHFFQWN